MGFAFIRKDDFLFLLDLTVGRTTTQGGAYAKHAIYLLIAGLGFSVKCGFIRLRPAKFLSQACQLILQR